MQAAPVIAGILLFGVVTLSGFKLVPESALSNGVATNLGGGGVQLSGANLAEAPRSALASETILDSDPIITALTVKSPQDIERSTATLRGRIVVGPEELGSVFFVYGYNQSDLNLAVTQSDSYTELNDNKRTSVQTKTVITSVRDTRDVSSRVGGLAIETDYYVRLCAEVESTLRCSTATDFETLDGPSSIGSVRIPTISVRDEELISGEEISLQVNLNMFDSNDGLVYVVYGESQAQVDSAVDEEYRDIDEDDEDLQKQRIATGVIGSQTFTVEIDDLDDNRQHYYTVCVEYDGRLDGVECTRVDSFTTPDDSFGDTPRVTTGVISVSGNTVALTGSINMRSFRNGQAFFVYGTDQNAVSDTEGQRAMTNIRQNEDRLQRVLVDSDVDQSDDFHAVVSDLLFATQYAARLCVEFENEDEQGRDQLYVECGETREFTTN